MLIIDRTQRTWATLSAVVSVVAGVVYICYANWSANGPSGGSVPGLIFGIIAAGMMVFAGLLAARRRFPAARIGSAQFWMKGHLWIGTLTVPFALFHAGFGLGGPVEILLWILFLAVILSGFWGLFLQQMLPRMMLENLPRETFIEQIPHLCRRFTVESDNMLSEVCGPLDVSLTTVEIKQFEPHLRPYFEEHRKKNRNDYPKTASDAVHFQKFLTRVYTGVPTLEVVKTSEAPQPVIAAVASPVMKSVAQIKAPVVPPSPAPVTAVAGEVPAAKPKPDPKALLAAAKAKAVAAPPADAAALAAPVPEASTPAPAVAPAKPDPRAMLAAAKAKKAQDAAGTGLAAVASPEAPANPVAPSLAAKPDPKAILAAARAKKAAEAAAVAAPDTISSSELVAPPEALPTVAPAKPDAKAMLAAARAKKAQQTAEEVPAAPPVETPVAPVVAPPASPELSAPPTKPDPKAILAAARAKKAAAEAAAASPEVVAVPEQPVVATAEIPPVPVVASAGKPDPKAMLAAAKARREAAAGIPVPATPVAEVAPPTPPVATPAGKPDAKAMLAAMKAKREAAAQTVPAAVAEAPPAAKPNPLAQLKAVKDLPPAPEPTLIAAARVAPPTPQQTTELKLFYLELIRPQLPLQPVTRSWNEAMRRSVMACRIRSDNQHPEFIRIFDHLLDLCEQRRQFAMTQRYHSWLHGWLLVHIPSTVALYLILLVHAVVALRVIPFGN